MHHLIISQVLPCYQPCFEHHGFPLFCNSENWLRWRLMYCTGRHIGLTLRPRVLIGMHASLSHHCPIQRHPTFHSHLPFPSVSCHHLTWNCGKCTHYVLSESSTRKKVVVPQRREHRTEPFGPQKVSCVESFKYENGRRLEAWS